MKGLIPVAEFDNRTQAEMMTNLLESFEISCWIIADDLGGVGPGQSFVTGVKVAVLPEDYEKARQIVGENRG